MVDVDQLPPEWGFRRGQLPPMGASPDGVLRHRAGDYAVPPKRLHDTALLLAHMQTPLKSLSGMGHTCEALSARFPVDLPACLPAGPGVSQPGGCAAAAAAPRPQNTPQQQPQQPAPLPAPRPHQGQPPPPPHTQISGLAAMSTAAGAASATAMAQAAAQDAAAWAAAAVAAAGSGAPAAGGTAAACSERFATDFTAPLPGRLPAEWGVRIGGAGPRQCSGQAGHAEQQVPPPPPPPKQQQQQQQQTAAAAAGPQQPASQASPLADSIEELLQRLQLSTRPGTAAAAAGNPAAAGGAAAAAGRPLAASGRPSTGRPSAASGSAAEPPLGGSAARSGGAVAAMATAAPGNGTALPPAAGGSWEEMVEIKNTCPFASKPSLSRKGKQRTQFILADKGPSTQVRRHPFYLIYCGVAAAQRPKTDELMSPVE